MYLLRYTLTKMREQDFEEAYKLALETRGEGKGSAILTNEETQNMFPIMQNLVELRERLGK